MQIYSRSRTTLYFSSRRFILGIMVKGYEKYGATTQKVLLLIGSGLAIGLSASPSRYFKIIKAAGKEWKDIEKRSLHRAIKNIYKSKMVDCRSDKDGMFVLTLTEKGKKRVLRYELESMKISKMKKWDGKWRVVLFDVPETKKKMRDILRFRLKKLDFFEFQKSVFVHPFDCQNEIDFLVEFYMIRPNVRFMVVESVDNELHLKKHFGLL